MKKVLTSCDEQVNFNLSNSSVIQNNSLIEINEMNLIENTSQDVILDDDDSRSADFLSDSNPIYPSDETSLNSSQSSLQQSSAARVNSLLLAQQMSISSNVQQQQHFSFIENNQSMLKPLPPLQIHVEQTQRTDDCFQFPNEFSTIKTSRIVIREHREHDLEDQQREQFRGYKQMRRQHQKQLKQVFRMLKLLEKKDLFRFFLLVSLKNVVVLKKLNYVRN